MFKIQLSIKYQHKVQKMFKKIHIEKILSLKNTGNIRILELGCGIPEYIVPYIKNSMGRITYVGIEPNIISYNKAKDLLKDIPGIKIYNDLAYELPEAEKNQLFDICFSISVLEHVKHLDTFIEMGAKYLNKGGYMIHRYDLGHSLYPDSLKEKIQLLISKYMPQIVPEAKYVSYIEAEKLIKLYEHNNVDYIKTTYHQMPNHKELMKNLLKSDEIKKETVEKIGRDIAEWEFDVSETINLLPIKIKEKMFPAVCVWGKKN